MAVQYVNKGCKTVKVGEKVPQELMNSFYEGRKRFVNLQEELLRLEEEVSKLRELATVMNYMWACEERSCPNRKEGCFRVRGEGDGECHYESLARELGIPLKDRR